MSDFKPILDDLNYEYSKCVRLCSDNSVPKEKREYFKNKAVSIQKEIISNYCTDIDIKELTI